jgi:formylglycine-generating enzyme required for sulfatase activity
MVLSCIPAGEFLMGSTAEYPDAYNNEHPQHSVYLDAYWIDQTEVTSVMYADFLNENSNQNEGGEPWFYAESEDVFIIYSGGTWQAINSYSNHPVNDVSWFGAKAYCEWVGRRLPTEAEWEKAARGFLEGKKYPWGDEEPVCTHGFENGAQYNECVSGLVPVKTFAPNDYGLYDMVGNVSEWVSSLYMPYPYDAYGGQENMSKAGDRVVRGGSWRSSSRSIRVSIRTTNINAIPYHDENGFRCAMSP